jgi:translation elongation factor EF-Tu-like GTPase
MDKFVDRPSLRMSFVTKRPDFIAVLSYRATLDGGRSGPAYSGYRPAVKFPFSDLQTSGQQKFLDKEVVYPGETVKAEMTIVASDLFQHQLFKGLEFDFREGARIIGTGKILEILNPILDKPIA